MCNQSYVLNQLQLWIFACDVAISAVLRSSLFQRFPITLKKYEINVSSFSSHWTIVPHIIFWNKKTPASGCSLSINECWHISAIIHSNRSSLCTVFPLHVVIESNRVCAWIKANKRRLKSRGNRIDWKFSIRQSLR